MNHKFDTINPDFLFMRNTFPKSGKLNIPLIRRQVIDTEHVSLIACSDTRCNDSEANKKKGVHFFVLDQKMTANYTHPQKNLKKFSQYHFLMTPDFSIYGAMDLWRQIESVAHSRWCGAYWQSQGLTVIPTIGWSTAQSYDFCFDGVEQHSIVAVSTLGSRLSRRSFLLGYEAMMDRLSPETIICYGKPFPEMAGRIVTVDYVYPTKRGA